MNRNRYLLAGIVLTAAAFAVTAALYARLPAQVPIHWNVRGEVDGYGAKQWAAFLVPGLMVGWLLLSRLLPWLSPQRFEIEPFWSTYQYLVFVIVAWMGYAQATVLWAALAKVNVGKAVVAGVLLLFALLGNVLGKVRPNFWIGVRTPWTIADERVWTDTHRFAARLYFAIGILGVIAVLAGVPLVWCFIGFMVGVFVPVAYSLLRYKQLVDGGGPKGRLSVPTLLFLVMVLLLIGGAGWLLARSGSRPIPPSPALVRIATDMLLNLEQHHLDIARQDFTARMRQALPAQTLREVWDTLVRANGEFRGRKGIRAERLAGYRTVFVTCQFGSEQVDFKVVFDASDRIAGLWVVSPRPQEGK